MVKNFTTRAVKLCLKIIVNIIDNSRTELMKSEVIPYITNLRV